MAGRYSWIWINGPHSHYGHRKVKYVLLDLWTKTYIFHKMIYKTPPNLSFKCTSLYILYFILFLCNMLQLLVYYKRKMKKFVYFCIFFFCQLSFFFAFWVYIPIINGCISIFGWNKWTKILINVFILLNISLSLPKYSNMFLSFLSWKLKISLFY